jgi:CRP-like cAMP-binding protein
MLQDVRRLLSASELFRQVPSRCIDQALDSAVKRSVEEDGFFFFQSDPATHVYLLISGRVKLLSQTRRGQQIIMRMVTPGHIFAGIALLEPDDGYPVTAKADEDCLALAWEARFLQAMASRVPQLSLNLMQLMHGHILELQERHRVLVEERVEQRIARRLLKLATQFGEKHVEGILIDIPLTRQELAEMSGTTLYTVSRTLKEWERRGLLRIGRQRVIICQPHALVRIVEALER